MCGISGLVGYPGKGIDQVHKMNLHMKDRGPDAEGIWSSVRDGGMTGPEVIFGQRRLAIIDLSESGSQPFVSASGRFVITFNGEIYNYREIAGKLLAEGKVKNFRSTSDTEVLIEAIEAYGAEETLHMLKGMFAFAVLDKKSGDIVLARDRVGEKPLYYGFICGDASKSTFVFASDIGAISKTEGFSNEINTGILDFYFLHGYIPAPYSIYRHIWKLTPGSYLRIKAPYSFFEAPDALADSSISAEVTGDAALIGSGDGWEQKRYFSMNGAAFHGQNNIFTGTRQEAADELERLLCNAIKGQMVADVPLGAFLSAGIDSSSIVSLMNKVAPGKVKTYTIGMEGKYDEAPLAGEIAAHLGVENTQMYINEEDAKKVIPLLAGMFGEPFADSSQIPTYLVSKMTREHVVVSLSGDAGDELFCGYRSYASIDRIWGKMKSVPAGLRSFAGSCILGTPLSSKQILRDKANILKAKGPISLSVIQNRIEADAGQISLAKGTLKSQEQLLLDDFLPEPLHESMLDDLTMYHPDDILVKVDRTAMAVSLETRVPFLDKEVIDFAWTLPIDYLRSVDEKGNFTGKLVLRDILYKYVPKELMDRPKKGFSVPIRKWLLEGELRDWAEALLDEKKIKQEGYLNAGQVRKLWDEFVNGGKWRPQIWYILMFENWLEWKKTSCCGTDA